MAGGTLRNIESLNIQPGALRPADYVNARVLAANTAETVTLPANAAVVLFSSNVDIYVNYTTTATVPGADVTDGTASELNPAMRLVSGLTTLSIISASAGICTISVWRI